MSPGDLIGYAEAARLLYPDENLHTIIARVRRLAMAGTLRQYRNPAPNVDARGRWLVSRSEVEQLAANGGAPPRSGGRPVKEPAAYNLRRLTEAIEHQLRQTPPRPLQVGYAREVLLALKAMQAQQDEVWESRELTRLYAELVEDFNAVWDAAEAAGVKVYQPMGQEDWRWERGERSGQAATAGAALIAALIAALNSREGDRDAGS
jgi:hypothetical protein